MPRRYVRSAKAQSVPELPRDAWRGQTFVEGSTGVEMEVIWNGSANGPSLLGDGYATPTTGDVERGRLHLAGGRS